MAQFGNVQGFKSKKKAIVGDTIDLSRKGNIDESIRELISCINSLDNYVTTSSCSGRIIVVSKDKEDCKKGCKWIVTSHTSVDPDEFCTQVQCEEKNMVLKFEPFILHVQCQDIAAAKKMQDCALSAGFRNSGTVFGRHKSLTLAVRGTHGLEVPLSDDQGLVVSEHYLRYIIDKANMKMYENEKKVENFSKAVFSIRDAGENTNVHSTKHQSQTKDVLECVGPTCFVSKK